MATYYVDTASSGGDGTTQATSGAQAAFATIAAVNGASFSAGDSILFKRGCTWREQLTVPSSGSAGSPITFGAYGSGNDPIISGGDVISTWSADIGTSLTDDINTLGLYFFNSDLTDSGNDIDLTTQASAATYVDDLYGNKAVRGNGTWWANNTTGFTHGTGSFTWEVVFRYTGTSAAVSAICAATNTANNTGLHLERYGNGVRVYGFTADAEDSVDISGGSYNDNTWHLLSLIVDRTGNTLKLYVDTTQIGDTLDITGWGTFDVGLGFAVGSLKARASTSPQLATTDIAEIRVSDTVRTPFAPAAGSGTSWSATVDTEPNFVLFDGVLGTKVASKAAIDSNREWFWEADVLYVYSETDPDTAYTSPGIEAATRDVAILIQNKDYITVDGLTAEMGNNWGAVLVWTGTDFATIQNCELRYSQSGIWMTTDSGKDNLFYNNDIHHNAYGFNAYLSVATSGHENYVRANRVYNNTVDGINIRANYFIVEYNDVHDNGTATIAGDGIHIYTSDNVEGKGQHNIIRYNKSYNNIGLPPDGMGIIIDQWTDYNDVYYNVVYGNGGPGIMSYDANHVNIYNNVSYSNNVVHSVGTEESEIILSSVDNSSDNITLKNNIAYATETDVYAIKVASYYIGKTVSITNNLWYAPNSENFYYWNNAAGNTLATWNALTEVGTDLNADPLFISTTTPDFRLQPNSTCINAGVDVGLIADYEGRPIGGIPDIGAYEFQGGDTPFYLRRPYLRR